MIGMKRLILMVIFSFISIAVWSQNDQVKKLRNSKGPIFHKVKQGPSLPSESHKTGPLEKNLRLQPWLNEGPAVQTPPERKIFGPKGKFLQNIPRKSKN